MRNFISSFLNNISLKCIYVTSYFESLNLFVNQHLAVETYYRLLSPQLFPTTSKILFLDSDMIVNADVSELFDIDISNYYLAAIKDIDISGQLYENDYLKNYLENTVKIKNGYNYFQAGCLLLNLAEIRKKYSTEDLIKIATENNWTYLDQDVLNHAFNDKVYYLPQKWNTMMDWREPNASRIGILKKAPLVLYLEYLKARENPKIIHYAGYQKPWNKSGCDFADFFWKYARQTVFYEEILKRFTEATTPKVDITPLQRQLEECQRLLNECQSRVSEIERSRRECFPRRTLLWRGCRKIWWKIKK